MEFVEFLQKRNLENFFTQFQYNPDLPQTQIGPFTQRSLIDSGYGSRMIGFDFR